VLPDIKSLTLEELQTHFAEWKQPAYRVAQLLEWLYVQRVTSWEVMTNLPKTLREKLRENFSLASLEQVIATSEQNGIAGIIATNTTLDHSAIPKSLDQAGGLSGRPLREKSTEFIRAIRAQSQLPIIASGGIFDAASAREKFAAGAQLIQVYTGYVYRGPGLLREIVEGL
jgi:dihydroorotate dehydrogenase